MKKSVIALIIILALVILVSPGIIGMLADNALEEQAKWVKEESKEVVIEEESYDRGWFSSEGTVRLSLNEAFLSDEEQMLLEGLSAGPLPDLIMETRVDHGLLPVSSLGREEGSLKPGLGSAVTTMALAFPDGRRIEIPGAIYSDIALSGETRSRYLLEAGGVDDIAWGDARVTGRFQPSDGSVDFDVTMESLSITAPEGNTSFSNLVMGGSMQPTEFGIATGEFTLVLEEMAVPAAPGTSMPMGPVSVRQLTSIVDGRVAGEFDFDFAANAVPGVGSMSIAARMRLDDADPEALGRLIDDLDQMPDEAAPAEILVYAGESLMDVSAAGFGFSIEQLDLTMPTGVVETSLNVNVPESDRADFSWPSMLLATEADADISIPSAMFDMIMMMSPEATQAVEMGILKKNGAVYEMEAVYKKGLLTVNGAPLPIPLGGF